MGRRVVIGFRDGSSVAFELDVGWTSEDEELEAIFNAAHPQDLMEWGGTDEPDPLLTMAMPIAKRWGGRVIWMSELVEPDTEDDRLVVY